MKGNFLCVLISLVCCLFSSCKDSDDSLQGPSPSQPHAVVGDVSVLPNDVCNYIENTIDDNSNIIFSNNTPDNLLPNVGSTIYIPESDKTPYGILAKVVSIQKGGNISVSTEPLSLDEAFSYLSIDASSPATGEIMGVFDEEGNSIEYQTVDANDIVIDNTRTVEQVTKNATKSTEVFQFDFDITKQSVKIPVELYNSKDKNNNDKDKIRVNGTAYIGFHKFDLNVDISDHKLNSIKWNTEPYVKIVLNGDVSAERQLELSERLFKLPFKITIPTNVGIPIIIPVTLYIDGACGISGQMKAEIGLQYEYNCNCVVSYQNGQWSSKLNHGGYKNKIPWSLGRFDIKGEIYSGFKIGLIAGLYSSTTGIGFNVFPRYSFGLEADITSEDLLKNNPESKVDLKVGGDVYCVAKLFGRALDKYSLKLPDFILWSQTVHLFPDIENFKVKGYDNSATVHWEHDNNYLLGFAKTGVIIFDSDQTTPVMSFKPSPSSSTFESNVYDVNATALSYEKTYYAAPMVYWKDYKFYGNLVKFTTESTGEVITLPAQNISTTSATIQGKLENPSLPVLQAGFYYRSADNSDYYYNERFVPATIKSDGTFEAKLSDLAENKEYTYYAYVVLNPEWAGAQNIFKGKRMSFTTSAEKEYSFRIQIISNDSNFPNYDKVFTQKLNKGRFEFIGRIDEDLENLPYYSIGVSVIWSADGLDGYDFVRSLYPGAKVWINLRKNVYGDRGYEITIDYFDKTLNTEWLSSTSDYTYFRESRKHDVKVKLTSLGESTE